MWHKYESFVIIPPLLSYSMGDFLNFILILDLTTIFVDIMKRERQKSYRNQRKLQKDPTNGPNIGYVLVTKKNIEKVWTMLSQIQ